MAAWLPWLDQNWFNLIQTAGIVGSLWLTATALRRDHRARKLGDLLTLAGQHRELWSEAQRRPELGRILQPEVDLVAAPISLAEKEFLNLVIVHFYTGWLMAKDAAMLTLDVLAADARSFFSLPIPHAVWDENKQFRDKQFVQFIETALAKKLRKAGRSRRR